MCFISPVRVPSNTWSGWQDCLGLWETNGLTVNGFYVWEYHLQEVFVCFWEQCPLPDTADVKCCNVVESCFSSRLIQCALPCTVWALPDRNTRLFGEGFITPNGKHLSNLLQRTYGLSFSSPLTGQIVLKCLHSWQPCKVLWVFLPSKCRQML